jgi:hypothetical protein
MQDRGHSASTAQQASSGQDAPPIDLRAHGWSPGSVGLALGSPSATEGRRVGRPPQPPPPSVMTSSGNVLDRPQYQIYASNGNQATGNQSQRAQRYRTRPALRQPEDGLTLIGLRLFLTYSRCPLEPEEALRQLRDVKGIPMDSWIAAQETHVSGDKHLHIYLGRNLQRYYLRNAETRLDLYDPATGQTYHGEYEVCRSPRGTGAYLLKEGIKVVSSFTPDQLQLIKNGAYDDMAPPQAGRGRGRGRGRGYPALEFYPPPPQCWPGYPYPAGMEGAWGMGAPPPYGYAPPGWYPAQPPPYANQHPPYDPRGYHPPPLDGAASRDPPPSPRQFRLPANTQNAAWQGQQPTATNQGQPRQQPLGVVTDSGPVLGPDGTPQPSTSGTTGTTTQASTEGSSASISQGSSTAAASRWDDAPEVASPPNEADIQRTSSSSRPTSYVPPSPVITSWEDRTRNPGSTYPASPRQQGPGRGGAGAGQPDLRMAYRPYMSPRSRDQLRKDQMLSNHVLAYQAYRDSLLRSGVPPDEVDRILGINWQPIPNALEGSSLPQVMNPELIERFRGPVGPGAGDAALMPPPPARARGRAGGEMTEAQIRNQKAMSAWALARRTMRRTKSLTAALRVLEKSPMGAKELTLHGPTIENNLLGLIPRETDPAVPLAAFAVSFRWMPGRTLMIIGAAGIGKTSLAKALLPHALFVRHIEKLKGYKHDPPLEDRQAKRRLYRKLIDLANRIRIAEGRLNTMLERISLAQTARNVIAEEAAALRGVPDQLQEGARTQLRNSAERQRAVVFLTRSDYSRMGLEFRYPPDSPAPPGQLEPVSREDLTLWSRDDLGLLTQDARQMEAEIRSSLAPLRERKGYLEARMKWPSWPTTKPAPASAATSRSLPRGRQASSRNMSTGPSTPPRSTRTGRTTATRSAPAATTTDEQSDAELLGGLAEERAGSPHGPGAASPGSRLPRPILPTPDGQGQGASRQETADTEGGEMMTTTRRASGHPSDSSRSSTPSSRTRKGKERVSPTKSALERLKRNRERDEQRMVRRRAQQSLQYPPSPVNARLQSPMASPRLSATRSFYSTHARREQQQARQGAQPHQTTSWSGQSEDESRRTPRASPMVTVPNPFGPASSIATARRSITVPSVAVIEDATSHPPVPYVLQASSLTELRQESSAIDSHPLREGQIASQPRKLAGWLDLSLLAQASVSASAGPTASTTAASRDGESSSSACVPSAMSLFAGTSLRPRSAPSARVIPTPDRLEGGAISTAPLPTASAAAAGEGVGPSGSTLGLRTSLRLHQVSTQSSATRVIPTDQAMWRMEMEMGTQHSPVDLARGGEPSDCAASPVRPPISCPPSPGMSPMARTRSDELSSSPAVGPVEASATDQLQVRLSPPAEKSWSITGRLATRLAVQVAAVGQLVGSFGATGRQSPVEGPSSQEGLPATDSDGRPIGSPTALPSPESRSEDADSTSERPQTPSVMMMEEKGTSRPGPVGPTAPSSPVTEMRGMTPAQSSPDTSRHTLGATPRPASAGPTEIGGTWAGSSASSLRAGAPSATPLSSLRARSSATGAGSPATTRTTHAATPTGDAASGLGPEPPTDVHKDLSGDRMDTEGHDEEREEEEHVEESDTVTDREARNDDSFYTATDSDSLARPSKPKPAGPRKRKQAPAKEPATVRVTLSGSDFSSDDYEDERDAPAGDKQPLPAQPQEKAPAKRRRLSKRKPRARSLNDELGLGSGGEDRLNTSEEEADGDAINVDSAVSGSEAERSSDAAFIAGGDEDEGASDADGGTSVAALHARMALEQDSDDGRLPRGLSGVVNRIRDNARATKSGANQRGPEAEGDQNQLTLTAGDMEVDARTAILRRAAETAVEGCSSDSEVMASRQARRRAAATATSGEEDFTSEAEESNGPLGGDDEETEANNEDDDELGIIRRGHWGVIFDDMSFRQMPRTGQIALVDVEDPTDIHMRYNVGSLPIGVPRIITTNQPAFEVLDVNDDAVRRRLQIVEMERDPITKAYTYKVWPDSYDPDAAAIRRPPSWARTTLATQAGGGGGNGGFGGGGGGYGRGGWSNYGHGYRPGGRGGHRSGQPFNNGNGNGRGSGDGNAAGPSPRAGPSPPSAANDGAGNRWHNNLSTDPNFRSSMLSSLGEQQPFRVYSGTGRVLGGGAGGRESAPVASTGPQASGPSTATTRPGPTPGSGGDSADCIITGSSPAMSRATPRMGSSNRDATSPATSGPSGGGAAAGGGSAPNTPSMGRRHVNFYSTDGQGLNHLDYGLNEPGNGQGPSGSTGSGAGNAGPDGNGVGPTTAGAVANRPLNFVQVEPWILAARGEL